MRLQVATSTLAGWSLTWVWDKAAHQPKEWYKQCPSPGILTTGPGCEASPNLR